jgi:hypothetical protein
LVDTKLETVSRLRPNPANRRFDAVVVSSSVVLKFALEGATGIPSRFSQDEPRATDCRNPKPGSKIGKFHLQVSIRHHAFQHKGSKGQRVKENQPDQALTRLDPLTL